MPVARDADVTDATDVTDVTALSEALYLAIGLAVRRLRQAPGALTGELSMSEISALSRLDRGGPATAAELAKREQISPQSMGATLAGLEDRGLIARRPHPVDGRKQVLSPTAAGAQLLHSRRAAKAELLAAALRGFSPAELRRLAAAAPLLDRLAQNL